MAAPQRQISPEQQKKMKAAGKGAKRYVPSGRKLLTDIRRNCLECCCGQTSEVEQCVSHKCIMFPHRMGITGYKQPERFDLDGGEGYLGEEDGEEA